MEVDTQGGTKRDTHALPPLFIQEAYWRYNKAKGGDLDLDQDVVDFERGLDEEQQLLVKSVGMIPASSVDKACSEFHSVTAETECEAVQSAASEDAIIYEHSMFPGLQIIPNLLPPQTQVLFTSQIMHKYLADPEYKNNLDADFDLRRKSAAQTPSFFTCRPNEDIATSRTTPASLLNAAQVLSTKLRWLTIGTQYDWPTRSYPAKSHFPADISTLVSGLFPHITPESGVCLLYGPKDYMPVHRDVSEQCERALASFSLGCDGIFLVARGEDEVDDPDEKRRRVVAIRVRSGDCIQMTGETRWAWHAMPRTIAGTCPEWLFDWPVGTPGATDVEAKAYAQWTGFMSRKRLNVSCRQVWD